jgi:5-methylcytosine-specific restriction endonuclease McrA
MFWFARYEKRQIIDRKDAIRDAMIRLCVEDPVFIDAITLGTGDIARVRTRFEIWGNELKRIVDLPAGERRLFSYAEKQALFDEQQTCAICDQRIETLDDAAVDHKTPYSKGGNTSIENAQLAHRYCNRVKSDT